MEKYKGSASKTKEARIKPSASSGGIKINLSQLNNIKKLHIS
jgi:hypothetical protein